LMAPAATASETPEGEMTEVEQGAEPTVAPTLPTNESENKDDSNEGDSDEDDGQDESSGGDSGSEDSESELETQQVSLFAEALPINKAVEEVGESDLAAAVASANNLNESQAEGLIAEQDPTVEVLPSGHISFLDPASESSAGGDGPDVAEVPGNPQDGSNPDSEKTIYLNFEGKELSNSLWNEQAGQDTISVSQADLDQEQQEQVWAAVAEDYAPFDVNVVIGADPDGGAVNKTEGDDEQYGLEMVIYSGSGGPADGLGGIALLGSFGMQGLNTAWVSVDGTGGGNALDVAMASSHEAGHTFGLFHDSHEGSDTGYYYPQDPSNVWGPIMGSPYGSPLSQWSDASYGGGVTLDGNNEPTEQDDLAEISTRVPADEGEALQCELPDGQVLYGGFVYNEETGDCAESADVPEDEFGELRYAYHDRSDYKGDDHGDDTDSATSLSIEGGSDGEVGDISAEGVIGQSDDSDVFAISVNDGPLTINVAPTDFAANLPVDLVVTDGDGNEIGVDRTEDRTVERQDDAGGISGLAASFESDGEVEAGTYYVTVEGGIYGDEGASSTADLASGWGQYGSLGNYTVSGQAVPAPAESVDITAPEDGAEIEREGAVVEGTGEPGAEVVLTAGDSEVGAATVNDDGAWSVELGELEVGEHEITATQDVDDSTDSVGVVVAPDPPEVTTPKEGDVAVSATPLFAGNADARADIVIYVDGEEAGTTTANGEGRWEWTPENELDEGDHRVSARQVVNEVRSSTSNVVNFTVDLSEDDGGGDNGGDDGDNGGGDGDNGDHPDTGANTAGFVGIAAVLLALGGAAILFTRRRGANVS